MKTRIMLLLIMVTCVLRAPAETIHLKDGKTIVGSKLRRAGVNLMITVPIGTGSGEIGYAVAQIISVDFAEPPELKKAAGLIAANQMKEALDAIEPALALHQTFRDIKGNYWPNAALCKLSILVALDKLGEAESLIGDMLAFKEDPNLLAAGSACDALRLARKGKAKEALESSHRLIQQETSDYLAMAYLAKGHAHLDLKEYEEAIFAYLRIPVFYPDQPALIPAALLGSARCYVKLQQKDEFAVEVDEAIRTLTQTYPNSLAAATARTEFPNVLSRIKQ